MSNSFLPEDLLLFIQVRLPIKSLLRFKSVSKSWNVLISSPEFIKLHLLQIQSSSIHKIANRLSYKDVYDKPEGLHSCLIHMAEFLITPGENLEIGCEFQRLYHPFESQGLEMDSKIVGSCNGLLCQILCSNCTYGDRYGQVYDEYNISLCNPLTKSSWVLPKRSLVRNNESVVCYGFGYDDVHDDYKVMITCTASYRPRYECEVYSLTSNTWRIVRSDLDFFGLERKKDGVLVNCALHWIMRDTPAAGANWIMRDTPAALSADEKNYVIAFDLRTDKHKILSLPKVLEKFEQGLELIVLNGCLLVYEYTISSLYRRPHASFDLWMMKDYGLKDSWMRIRIRNSSYNLCTLVPVALLEDSHHEKLVYFRYDNHGSMIFVYDIVSHQVLTFPVYGGWRITERLEFVGSLVQPHPPNIETKKNTFRGSPKKNKKKKKKKRKKKKV